MKVNKYDSTLAFDYETGFISTSDKRRLFLLLSHYELYKKIINVPGEILEVGVFKGNSFLQWATFRDMHENNTCKKIIGFDMFDVFPEISESDCAGDKKFRKEWVEVTNNEYFTKEELLSCCEIKDIKNIELIQGNVLDTLSEYLKNNPDLQLSLLHIDTDVYQPYKETLSLLYKRVTTGGIIAFDDYGIVEGATRAVNEFLEDKIERIHKLPYTNKPSYIIRGEK